MSTSGLQKDILMLDEQAVHDRYKFGVLYIKEGQTREEEWLSNNHDSKHFDHFLNIIGRKVPLKGYNGWAGGLDTKGGYSGEHTFVNEWNGHNIAYHVSTLIPAHPGDKQQVQRKRHIGNDIVCVVFAEGKQPFNPAAIKSQFLHVFIIVHPEEWNGRIGWRVEIAMAENVPSFGPSLPSENAVFFDEAELCSFMLAKLINAEYAAYQSPKFAQPMARAREGILAHLLERGNKIAQPIELSSTATNTPSSSSLARHIKSPSTSSDKSSKSAYSNSSDAPVPVPSRSSMIKDFSEGIIAAGLGPAAAAAAALNDKSQFPSANEFDDIVNDYLQNLSLKKRDKALVDQKRYQLILCVLKDPRNTSISTAQFRFWVKKMFQLVDKDIVYHDNKPVAMREQIYSILVTAHRQAHHGGRDKTSALVRKRYSWIPKELIARFVRHCPFCITRRNGCGSPP
ncbi:hypothetical protein K492DRAFT_109323, partial [Lichtheimia hyalospora FSU 10163]